MRAQQAEIGMMDAKLAAKIMYADSDAATIQEEAEKYKELQSSPLAAARRGYVDTIIEPADTRKYVIGAFEMLFTRGKNVRQRNTERFSEVKQVEEKDKCITLYFDGCILFCRMRKSERDSRI